MTGRRNDRRPKQTYRWTDRQQTYRQPDTKTDKRLKNSESARPTDRETPDKQAEKKTDRQNEMERQTYIDIDRQTERQTF